MTVAKSAYTLKQSKYNRASGVNQKAQEAILNKCKVVKDKSEINTNLKRDEHINLDKIKKYFENVLNEQHFLENYNNAKQRGDIPIVGTGSNAAPPGNIQDATQINYQQNRYQQDINIAKKYMKMSLIGPDYFGMKPISRYVDYEKQSKQQQSGDYFKRIYQKNRAGTIFD